MQGTGDSRQANTFKNEGNGLFQAGQYAAAESKYSQAILADDSIAALYTNRALARLKLRLWDSAIDDCQTCLKINSESMKAYYYMAQAQVELGNFDDALLTAKQARNLCVQTNDKSLGQVTVLVLRCKKERWEHMDKWRKREDLSLEGDMIAAIRREADDMIKTTEDAFERRDITQEYEAKILAVQEVFERSRENDDKKRVVPDWMICDITFNVFVDPVVTKSGKSYERSAILEHLRLSRTDPLTRETLTPLDLRPNIALREACNAFLEENGWAADY
ncbi:hypothetical protein LQW54_004993 [Pestalotiopsis sp. IQ-011]